MYVYIYPNMVRTAELFRSIDLINSTEYIAHILAFLLSKLRYFISKSNKTLVENCANMFIV